MVSVIIKWYLKDNLRLFCVKVKLHHLLLLQVVLCLTGMVSSGIAIIVLSGRNFNKNIFHQLLLCLAIFDLIHLLLNLIDCLGRYEYIHSSSMKICLISVLVYGIADYLYRYITKYISYSHVSHSSHSLLTPYLLYPMKAISLTCSIFMMMSLAMERYVAVYKPFSR